MLISASILSIKDNIKQNIEKLDKTKIDMIHLDIMDGNFVKNKTWELDELKDLLENTTKYRDVHLMVSNVKEYVDKFAKLNPVFITFHEEAVDDIQEMIKYIRIKGIRAGISIKPNTKVESILSYLPYIDLVLVMSVEPGAGGQQFIFNTINKVNQLKEYRQQNNLRFYIEVDGGINKDTIKLLNSDIAVVGSYITNNDYDEAVNILKSI